MKRVKVSFAWPTDAALWHVGDTLRTQGEERIVTRTAATYVELRAATWWRRAWYALRRWAVRA